jgi:uncharacterized protein (DUF58 family)
MDFTTAEAIPVPRLAGRQNSERGGTCYNCWQQLENLCMPLRRRAWLSREGWYYAFVLAFIVGGAVLRSINLLVILAGMMMAPLLLNWRVVMASLRGLVVHRKLPEQVTAGEPLTVEIAIENRRRTMGSWMVVVEDWVERMEEPRIGILGSSARSPSSRQRPWWQHLKSALHLGGTQAEAIAANVPAHGTATATYRITLARRGRYRFGPLRVSTRFPLGLVWGHFTQPEEAELVVAPKLGRLLPEWANLLEAQHSGDQRSHPQRGVDEGDYYGLRPWQSGDSTRWIHWRSTAKHGVPTVLQFERQRSRDVALVLDPWLPANAEQLHEGLLELAISLAATAVADLTSRGHSRLLVAVAGPQPQCWAGPASAMFCHEVLAQLAVLPAADGGSLQATLSLARDQAPSGARLIVVSPRGPQVAADPERNNLLWIDVSGPELETLFVLE